MSVSVRLHTERQIDDTNEGMSLKLFQRLKYNSERKTVTDAKCMQLYLESACECVLSSESGDVQVLYLLSH